MSAVASRGAQALQDELLDVIRVQVQSMEIFLLIFKETKTLDRGTSMKLIHAMAYLERRYLVELSHLAIGWPRRLEPHVEMDPDGTARLVIPDFTEKTHASTV